MPKKSASSSRRGADPAARILEAALALAAREGSWRRLSLAAIAAEAGLPLLDVYAIYRSKAEILEAFQRRVDREVLASIEPDPGERPRDLLFDAIMRRFDTLRPHKDAVRAITRDAAGDPVTALGSAPAFAASMGWMLETAGVASAGWRGALRVHALGALYLLVLRVWLDDDSPEMMKTMAALDRRLRQGAIWLGLAPPRSGGDSAAEDVQQAP
jgi:AcrR family transcriptional regulator